MTSDLDLPLSPSADQIRRREFATVRRGYDPDQVRDYLTQVADQVETLEGDLRETRMLSENKAAAPMPSEAPEMPVEPVAAAPAAANDPYERLTARFATLIQTADEEATRIVEEANAEAATILEDARSEADRIRVDAQSRAEEARQQGAEALAKAKEESDRVLGELATKRQSLVDQMQSMQEKLLTVVRSLEVADDEHLAAAPGDAATPADPEAAAAPAKPAAAPKPKAEFDEDLVDPRYEDLWVSNESDAIDIPDLAGIELDLDEESRDKG